MKNCFLFLTAGAFIGFLAREIFEALKPKTARFEFSRIQLDQTILEGDIKKMELRFGQSVKVKATPKDEFGDETGIETGTARWEVSDDEIASLEVNPDNELEATITAGNFQGAVVVTLNADGDPSSGAVAEIFGSADVRVLGKNAVGFDLSFGEASSTAPSSDEPEPQPSEQPEMPPTGSPSAGDSPQNLAG